MKSCLFVSILLVSPPAFTNCYVVGDFKGRSVREYDKFKADDGDGFSSQLFVIDFRGGKAKISPNNLLCTPFGSNMAVCVHESPEGGATAETWTVYPESRKVLHTKSRSGYILDGGSLFIGNIKSRCDQQELGKDL